MKLRLDATKDPRRFEYWKGKSIIVNAKYLKNLFLEWNKQDKSSDFLALYHSIPINIKQLSLKIIDIETGTYWIDEAYVYVSWVGKQGIVETEYGISLTGENFIPNNRRYLDLWHSIYKEIDLFLGLNPEYRDKEDVTEYYNSLEPPRKPKPIEPIETNEVVEISRDIHIKYNQGQVELTYEVSGIEAIGILELAKSRIEKALLEEYDGEDDDNY